MRVLVTAENKRKGMLRAFQQETGSRFAHAGQIKSRLTADYEADGLMFWF
jgi:hypothetical protein